MSRDNLDGRNPLKTGKYSYLSPNNIFSRDPDLSFNVTLSKFQSKQHE